MENQDIKFLTSLERTILSRLNEQPDSSYTAKLAAAGDKRVAQKVGEEAVELALAAVAGDRQEQISEAADLLFHTLVLLSCRGIRLADVVAELESRHGG
jgi:phosphoribosyl-ATP pyrophosphohydrolase/phosphoribosyl-AMP cyclohydrolase